jgi:hypothetical protein
MLFRRADMCLTARSSMRIDIEGFRIQGFVGVSSESADIDVVACSSSLSERFVSVSHWGGDVSTWGRIQWRWFPQLKRSRNGVSPW